MSNQPTWREQLPLHPACKSFPDLSEDELVVLGESIRVNGLLVPIVVLANRKKGTSTPPLQLLDGKNRLVAMERVGIKFNLAYDYDRENDGFSLEIHRPGHESIACDITIVDADDVDPVKYAEALNAHRRQLTAEQKRDAIAELLKVNSGLSDRTISKMVKDDHKKVGRVRAKMEASGAWPHVEKRTDSKGRQQPAKKAKPTVTKPTSSTPGQAVITAEQRKAETAAAEAEAQAGPVEPETEEESFLDDAGNFAPAPRDPDARVRGFLYRAQQSTFGAEADGLDGIAVTEEILEAAREAEAAWAKLRHRLESMCIENDADSACGDKVPEQAEAAQQGEKAEEKPTKLPKNCVEQSLANAIASAFEDLSDLAMDCRQAVENLPDGLRDTERNQTLEQSADTLDQLAAPEVPESLADIKVVVRLPRKRRSRADRRNDASALIELCRDALGLSDDDPRCEDAQSLVDELDNAISEAESCEFPGMYG